jgi:RimJ/RimL family protein N-acetyltransferase
MERRTPRLLLREFEASDAPAVQRWQSDPMYLRYYAWTERTDEDVREFVQMFLDWQAESPVWCWQLVIVPDGEGGRALGDVGLRLDAPGALTGNIGYELDSEVWGRGYATEAAEEMLRFGFDELGLHRIWSWCIADNTGSRRVLERLGMRYEGQQRQHEYFKGRWWDHRLYGLLADEWRARGPLGSIEPATEKVSS